MSEESDLLVKQRELIALQRNLIGLLQAEREDAHRAIKALVALSEDQCRVLASLAIENAGMTAFLEAARREVEAATALVMAQPPTDTVN